MLVFLASQMWLHCKHGAMDARNFSDKDSVTVAAEFVSLLLSHGRTGLRCHIWFIFLMTLLRLLWVSAANGAHFSSGPQFKINECCFESEKSSGPVPKPDMTHLVL